MDANPKSNATRRASQAIAGRRLRNVRVGEVIRQVRTGEYELSRHWDRFAGNLADAILDRKVDR